MLVGIVSLGCAKNLVDSQNAMSFLKAQGHKFTDDARKADVIIVNTCGFINDAKQESIDSILEMAQYKVDYKCKYLIVMGCLVQRYRADLEAELKEVDCFISISEYDKLPEIFMELLGGVSSKSYRPVLATNPWTAYLRIADGCSNRCSYCAIPLIRGNYVSVPFEEVIRQAKELSDLGVKELNIIAQDTTRYGIDLYDRHRLPDILDELNKMDFHWIRILYMYPDEIDDAILDGIKRNEKVVPYFDIPVQYGNDRLLLAMNRRGNVDYIKYLVKTIRERFEEPTLRTTMIVGFPTETDEDFKDLMEFVKETKWDRLGAFTYSLEEDTRSYDMFPRVDEEVANKRLEELMSLQEEIAQKNSERFIGTVQEVLVETMDRLEKVYVGRSKQCAPDGIDGFVQFESEHEYKPGDFVFVKIESAHVHDLYGKDIN